MVDYYSLFIATCDVNHDVNCWVEGVIALFEGDTREEADNALTMQGWEINEDGTCTCPWCGKGIVEDKYLKRVK